MLNNATWPDFTRLPNHLEPVVNFRELLDETPIELDGVRFTPIPVSHPVPTHGFLIEDGDTAFDEIVLMNLPDSVTERPKVPPHESLETIHRWILHGVSRLAGEVARALHVE